MAIASNKKASKKKASSRARGKAGASKTATKKRAARAAPKRAGKAAAGGKQKRDGKAGGKRRKVTEPERAAPAMAEVDEEVLEFIAAIDRFKQQHGRPFPSWSEVLLIVRELGYRRERD